MGQSYLGDALKFSQVFSVVRRSLKAVTKLTRNQWEKLMFSLQNPFYDLRTARELKMRIPHKFLLKPVSYVEYGGKDSMRACFIEIHSAKLYVRHNITGSGIYTISAHIHHDHLF